METEETAPELIGLACDAVLIPRRWAGLRRRLASARGAGSAMLREIDNDAGSEAGPRERQRGVAKPTHPIARRPLRRVWPSDSGWMPKVRTSCHD